MSMQAEMSTFAGFCSKAMNHSMLKVMHSIEDLQHTCLYV